MPADSGSTTPCDGLTVCALWLAVGLMWPNTSATKSSSNFASFTKQSDALLLRGPVGADTKNREDYR